MILPNPKLILAGGLLLVILSLTTWGFYERSGKLSIKADYDGFIAKAQILAAERLVENARKEKEYETKLRSAESARSVALAKLREHQKRADLSGMSFLPVTPANRVCFDRTQLESAIGVLVKDLQGFAEQGDIALIDTHTLLEAWPK